MTTRISWPDVSFSLLDSSFSSVFQRVNPTRKNLADVAKLSHIHHNVLRSSVLSWLLQPKTIEGRLEQGDLAIYGMFIKDEMAGFGLLRALENDLVVEGSFVCTLPLYQKTGIARDIILSGTLVTDQTPAVLFYADAVCSHSMSQRALESAGCIPCGILPNFERFGESSTVFGSNETLVRYIRFPKNDPAAWVAMMAQAKLTPAAKTMFDALSEILEEKSKTIYQDPEASLKLVG